MNVIFKVWFIMRLSMTPASMLFLSICWCCYCFHSCSCCCLLFGVWRGWRQIGVVMQRKIQYSFVQHWVYFCSGFHNAKIALVSESLTSIYISPQTFNCQWSLHNLFSRNRKLISEFLGLSECCLFSVLCKYLKSGLDKIRLQPNRINLWQITAYKSQSL